MIHNSKGPTKAEGGVEVVINDPEDLSTHVLESGMPRHRALEQDRILAQVNKEGFRGPASNELDAIEWGTGKRKGCGTTSAK